jgi:hypothetical protein
MAWKTQQEKAQKKQKPIEVAADLQENEVQGSSSIQTKI